jgi:hypothetical protein
MGALTSFSDVFRVLKPNSFCISFYGWGKVDTFFQAWRAPGFRPVGHIVWPKGYASSTGFLQAYHEQAYMCSPKAGRVNRPSLEDVMTWKYTGNRAHPTEKAVDILRPRIRFFSRPSAIVLDPFSGSGSTAAAATSASSSMRVIAGAPANGWLALPGIAPRGAIRTCPVDWPCNTEERIKGIEWIVPTGIIYGAEPGQGGSHD